MRGGFLPARREAEPAPLHRGPRRPDRGAPRRAAAAAHLTVTVRSLLEGAVARLEDAHVAFGHGTLNAVDEAAWLILHALGLPVHDLNSHLDLPVDAPRARAARALVAKRIRTRKPAAYLLNEAWLGPHRFYVDERVIIPRSFIAELLNRGQISRSSGKNNGDRSILDLCTGSGCLAILAALAYPGAKVDAADLSEDALAVARRNVDDYGLVDRIRLVKSDLFSALRGRRYDLIISNPPYVKASSMRKLPQEYRNEPAMALASGKDGLDHTRAILSQAAEHLNPRGRLVVEIGHNRRALEKSFPTLDLQWPLTSGGRKFVFSVNRPSLTSWPWSAE